MAGDTTPPDKKLPPAAPAAPASSKLPPKAEALKNRVAAGGAAEPSRGRGRPPGAKNKQPAETTDTKTEAGAVVGPWTPERTRKALDRLCSAGVRWGIKEWDVPAEERDFAAPYITPYLNRLFPNPDRADVLVTLLVVVGVFGKAIYVTFTRAKELTERASAWVRSKFPVKAEAAAPPASSAAPAPRRDAGDELPPADARSSHG